MGHRAGLWPRLTHASIISSFSGLPRASRLPQGPPPPAGSRTFSLAVLTCLPASPGCSQEGRQGRAAREGTSPHQGPPLTCGSGGVVPTHTHTRARTPAQGHTHVHTRHAHMLTHTGLHAHAHTHTPRLPDIHTGVPWKLAGVRVPTASRSFHGNLPREHPWLVSERSVALPTFCGLSTDGSGGGGSELGRRLPTSRRGRRQTATTAHSDLGPRPRGTAAFGGSVEWRPRSGARSTDQDQHGPMAMALDAVWGSDVGTPTWGLLF